MKKLKEIFNNLKNYYSRNRSDVLTLLGFFGAILTIILVIALTPMTNYSGLPLERTLELFTIIFIGVASLSLFL